VKSGATKPVRCAIYTRVSTEHGLEQDFNALDAQHDLVDHDDVDLPGPDLSQQSLQRRPLGSAAGITAVICWSNSSTSFGKVGQ